MKKILSLIIVLISFTITAIPASAESYEEYCQKWLANQKAMDEKYMDELEADGNLTQEAINSITKGKSNRKPNKKSKTTSNATGSSTGNQTSNTDLGKGWVFSTDELHVTGLPVDPETGYTKSGWYGNPE